MDENPAEIRACKLPSTVFGGALTSKDVASSGNVGCKGEPTDYADASLVQLGESAVAASFSSGPIVGAANDDIPAVS